MRGIVRFFHLSIFYLTESVDDQLLGLFFKPNEYFVVSIKLKYSIWPSHAQKFILTLRQKNGLNFNYRLCSNLMRFKS